jgi:T4 gene Gp59 loader of gp41 DNA helicase
VWLPCGLADGSNGMNGYEVFCKYQAIKLHFNSPSYCYFKYNGHVATKEAGFEKRKDKYSFHRLARTLKDHEVVGFFLATFLDNPKAYTEAFLEPEAKERYLAWQTKMNTLTFLFDRDIGRIVVELDKYDMGIASMFRIPNNGSYPVVWELMNQHEIEFETVVILHGITGMLDLWDNHYKSDYIYEKTSKLIRKYEPFLGLDVPKFQAIVKTHLTSP